MRRYSNMNSRRGSSRAGCGDPPPDPCGDRPLPASAPLAALVEHYRNRHRSRVNAERARFAAIRSLAAAIEAAAGSETEDGTLSSHQCRIGRARLCRAKELLLADGLAGVEDFDSLIAQITTVCVPVKGFGPLARYDIASRLGAYLGHEPEQVYLHTGALKGAQALGVLRRSRASVHGGRIIERDDLPKELQTLSPADLENFLCIYQDELERFHMREGKERAASQVPSPWSIR